MLQRAFQCRSTARTCAPTIINQNCTNRKEFGSGLNSAFSPYKKTPQRPVFFPLTPIPAPQLSQGLAGLQALKQTCATFEDDAPTKDKTDEKLALSA